MNCEELEKLGIKREEAIGGAPVSPRVWLPETREQIAWRDFLFEFSRLLGIIWLVRKIPFLKHKDWVAIRLEEIQNQKYD